MATLNRLVTVFSANTTAFVMGTKKMSMAMRMFRTNVIASSTAINSSLTRMGLAAGIAAGFMIKHYATFEKRMVTVGAILNKDRVEMELLTEAAKRMGRTTIFTATQAAEAQQVMAMAGLSQNEILLALGPALQLAAVGEVEIADAAEIAAKTMRGMGLSASDLYRVNNVLAGALVSSTTNMTQLGNALKYVAPLAAATNTSIEDTVAMIGKLSTAGFQGEMAGTGLRQAMAKLAGSTPHATKVLKELGITTVDSSKNMLPMFDIIEQMEGQALSAGQIFEVFGARAGPQMLALLAVGSEGLREYSKSLVEANDVGKAGQIEQQKLNTIWGSWRLMISAVSGVVIDSSEQIADAIRNAQFRFIEFFDNLDSRAGIINVLSNFMESFIGTLESLMLWLNENQRGVLEFVGALAGITVWIFNFLAAHPQLMAALVALKIAGFMGITTAVLSMAKALWALVLMLFPALTATMESLKATVLGLTASVRTFSLVMGGVAFATIAAGYIWLQTEMANLTAEYEKGIVALERLQRLQMKSIDSDTRKALKIKDAAEQMEALEVIQKKVALTTINAESSLKGERQELALLQKTLMNTDFGLLYERGILETAIKASKEQIESHKNALESAIRRAEDLATLIEHADARVQAGVESKKNAAAKAAAAAASSAATGAAAGGGGGGGGGGEVGDVDKAIAERIKDTRRTEEREQFGRPTARTGAELEKFLDMGPAKGELISFMDTIDLLTQLERDGLIARRSAAIAAGQDIATADESFRQMTMIRLQQHHKALEVAEDKKKLQEVQKKAGSLQEQMEADKEVDPGLFEAPKEAREAAPFRLEAGSTPMSIVSVPAVEAQEASPGGMMGETLQLFSKIRDDLDSGAISAQEYSYQLARVTTSYNTGMSVAKQVEKVEYTKAHAADIASGATQSYAKQFTALQHDFLNGKINTSQYKVAVQNLSQAMRESTKAAREEASAEKAKAAATQRAAAAARGGRGRGGGGGGGGGAGGQQAESTLGILFKELSLAMARTGAVNPYGDKYSRDLKALKSRTAARFKAELDIAEIQKKINDYTMRSKRQQLAWMLKNAPMYGTAGVDPGMVTKTEGNVTMSFPNVTRMNNEEIASVSDRIDEYRSRQGRQVV